MLLMDGWFIKEEQHASKMGNIMQSTWADFNNMDWNINKRRVVGAMRRSPTLSWLEVRIDQLMHKI